MKVFALTHWSYTSFIYYILVIRKINSELILNKFRIYPYAIYGTIKSVIRLQLNITTLTEMGNKTTAYTCNCFFIYLEFS